MAQSITIYTRTTCAYCPMVKKYLDAKGKTYTTVNLDEQPELTDQVIKMSGAMTVPITVFQNETDKQSRKIVTGWKPGEIAAALAA